MAFKGKVMNDKPDITIGYIQLCAAIVNYGIKQNDQVFLKSAWCKELIDYVTDYVAEHDSGSDSKLNIGIRGY